MLFKINKKKRGKCWTNSNFYLKMEKMRLLHKESESMSVVIFKGKDF